MANGLLAAHRPGRLSEMFGESQLDTDRFLRTLGWARVVQEEIKQLDPRTLASLQAYADGVNAYLATHQGEALSLEYAFLSLLHPEYHPEPWVPLHSLTWAKAMAWDLGGNMETEIQRAVLMTKLGTEMIDELYPPYPAQNPVIVPGAAVQESGLASMSATTPSAIPILEGLTGGVDALNRLMGGGLAGIGSNNWVVGGELTTTGMPLLANDTHLGIRMPSIWYETSFTVSPLVRTARSTSRGSLSPAFRGWSSGTMTTSLGASPMPIPTSRTFSSNGLTLPT